MSMISPNSCMASTGVVLGMIYRTLDFTQIGEVC